MKKTILIEIALAFAFCATIAGTIELLSRAHNLHLTIEQLNLTTNELEVWTESFIRFLVFGIFTFFATICNLVAIVLIAIKDFPVFKPLVDKLKARKAHRAEVKAERSEADRKARIEQLQSELDALKKDGD